MTDTTTSDRRQHPRLRLGYPIQLRDRERRIDLDRATTEDLSARGAFFNTRNGDPFRLGLPVELSVQVPHRIATDGREVLLDLRGRGRVVRLERPGERGFYGEDGVSITGVAIEFNAPLRFCVDWF